jgi:hypothetical protein
MTDEYLARHNSDFFWWMIVFGIMFVIMIAGFLYARTKLPEERRFYRLKFVWAAIIVFVGYMFISVPYVGHFYRFGETPKIPDSIQSADESHKHLVDHERRIARLEQELAESRDEVREVRDHYQRVIQFLMTVIFVYGFTQILKKDPHINPDRESALNLKD